MSAQKNKRKPGRPRKPDNVRRSVILRVRVSVPEKKELDRQAKAEGTSLSEVMLRPWRREYKEREGK
jgi:hypothetical protein